MIFSTMFLDFKNVVIYKTTTYVNGMSRVYLTYERQGGEKE